jgi:hypothetical protein
LGLFEETVQTKKLLLFEDDTNNLLGGNDKCPLKRAALLAEELCRTYRALNR